MQQGAKAVDSTATDSPERKAAARRVVVVDLDRTLLIGDSLHEQVIRLLFFNPLLLLKIVLLLLKGRAAFKAACAEYVSLDIATLPACPDVLSFLRNEQENGSYLVLCTAADKRIADAAANHFGLFDEVIATDNGINLKGPAKAAVLAARFPEGVVYAGDHADDLAVWARATGIVLVGVKAGVETRARELNIPILAAIHRRPGNGRSLLRLWASAVRVHHWSKNVLVFVPIVLAHQWSDTVLFTETFFGFVLLIATTASCYLINDLADLDADRRHATKRNRAIASGALPLSTAVLIPLSVLPVALFGAFELDLRFAAIFALYLGLTLAYSFYLKRIPLLDTFVIATIVDGIGPYQYRNSGMARHIFNVFLFLACDGQASRRTRAGPASGWR